MGYRRITYPRPDLNDPSLIWAPDLINSQGVMIDESPEANHGTITPPVHQGQGIIQKNLEFQHGGMVVSGNDTALQAVDPSYTFSCWVRHPGATTNEYVFWRGTQLTGIMTSLASIYAWGQDDGGHVLDSYSARYNDGLFHHLVCVHDRDVGLYLYTAGVERVFTAGTVQTFSYGAHPFYLSAPGSQSYEGYLAAPAVYSEAKSAAWVRREFNKLRHACWYKGSPDIPVGVYGVGTWISGTSFKVVSGTVSTLADTVHGKSEIVVQPSFASNIYLYADGQENGAAGPPEALTYGEWEFSHSNPGVNSTFYFGGVFNYPALILYGAGTASMVRAGGATLFASAAGVNPVGTYIRWRVRIARVLTGVSGAFVVTVWADDALVAVVSGSNPSAQTGANLNLSQFFRFQSGAGARLCLSSLVHRAGWEVQV